jgi:hypothetical protein
MSVTLVGRVKSDDEAVEVRVLYAQPGEEVYVLGTARETAGWDGQDHLIDEPTQSGDFVLSDKSEDTLVTEGRWGGGFMLVFGAAAAGIEANEADETRLSLSHRSPHHDGPWRQPDVVNQTVTSSAATSPAYSWPATAVDRRSSR